MVSTTLPLSLRQHEVWLDQRAFPGSAHLNIGGCCFLDGPLDRGLLARALEQLVAESEALRLQPQPDGSQRLLDTREGALEYVDLGCEPDPSAAVREWWQVAFREPIPIDGFTRPWRVVLLAAGPDRHGVMIKFHHLVMDGWGTSQVFQRWAAIYATLARGGSAPPPDGAGYRHFIEASRAYQGSAAYARDREYWHATLAELPATLIDERHPADAADSLPRARLHTCYLPRALYTRMRVFADSCGASVYHLFLAALALYFGRMSGRDQVLIGVPSLNRSGRRSRDTLGMFAGVFPLPVAIPPCGDVSALLGGIATALRGAYRHRSYPLSALGQDLELLRHGRERLFDILLSFERQDYAVRFGDAVLGEARQLFTGIARYPLAVTVCEFHPEQDVELVLEASATAFARGEPQLLGRRLRHLLEALVAGPTTPLGAIDVLPEAERLALLEGTHADVPSHRKVQPFINAFEQQAALHPEAVALLWEAGRLDYGELNRRANRLAQRLQALGVGADVTVVVAMERMPQTVAALLAVAKAGAAFVPVDPELPVRRMLDILGTAGAAAVLTQERFASLFSDTGLPVLTLDGAASPLLDATLADHNPAFGPSPGDLAYVLFTSGSGGRPKGVMVEHGALARRLAWLARTYGIGPGDRSGQFTQLTFDPALIELLLPLTHGASIALPPPGRHSAQVAARFSAAFGVSFIAFVPTTLARFLAASEDLDGLRLRVACCGGEVLAPELAVQFSRRTGGRLYNVYGPTEATIFATAWECGSPYLGRALPVGRPVDDSRIYVLDDTLRPLPTAVVGEICIGGEALARGYLGAPETERNAFAVDPFVPGGRIYRTGDLGYWGTDGNLYFSGRRDRQVKLRGYRIEPGEVESVLRTDPAVAAAAVKLVTWQGRKALYAWVASHDNGSGVSEASLNARMRKRLPDYMLPVGISLLPQLPEGTSGKVDYRALDVPSQPGGGDGVGKIPPGNALEERLLALWRQALGREDIGIGDNFFDLGGDSLGAVDLLAGIDAMNGRRNPLSLLTAHPTIAELAAVMAGQMGGESLLVSFGDGVGEVPLYLVASGHGDALRLAPLAGALDGYCSLHMLQPPLAAGCSSIIELAGRYADVIQERSADTVPPLLAGFSVGGITALETARLLRQRGVPFRGPVLLDTLFPNWLVRRALPWRLAGWLVRTLRFQELNLNERRLGSLFSDPGLSAQVCALRRYQPCRYDGELALVVSSGLSRWERWMFAPWFRLAAMGVTRHRVTGLHGAIFSPDNVGEVATVLRDLLNP